MPVNDPLQGGTCHCEQAALRTRQAYELLAYLLTSAELCTREPLSYGTFRLADAAGRLATAMLQNLPAQDQALLRRVAADVEAHKDLVMRDSAAFENFVAELVEQVAGDLLPRLKSSGRPAASSRHDTGETGMGGPDRPDERSSAILARLLETRRVVRSFATEPVPDDWLRRIVRAGGHGTTAGNRRIQQLLILDQPGQIRAVKAFAPGIWGTPAALIVILLDLAAAERSQVQIDRDETVWIDVGIAAMNMMLMAHSLGLGSCPASSFSRRAVRLALGLPESLRPAFMIQLGWPAQPRSSDPAG
jgi:nitroreductase